MGKFRVNKAGVRLERPGTLWSLTLSFIYLCVLGQAHAGGLSGVLVVKHERFSTRIHLVLGTYTHTYKACNVDWLYSLEIQVLSHPLWVQRK